MGSILVHDKNYALLLQGRNRFHRLVSEKIQSKPKCMRSIKAKV